MSLIKENLVIVGAGMAGSRLAEKIQEEYPQRFSITLIGEEREVGYNRILLSSLLAKECVMNDLSLIDVTRFTHQKGVVIKANPVIDIDCQSKQIGLQDGRRLGFDKLILATGSRSSRLVIPGAAADNVIGFRDMQDVSVMTSLTAESRVVVIGGGLLGLEAAVGLMKRGHKVTVLHRAKFLLNRQLDETAAGLLLSRLSAMGIEFRLGVTSKEFHLSNKTSTQADSVTLSTSETITASLFVCATGIDPEVSLAKKSGLIVNRAIVVNQHLETSMKDVFALGECSEFEGHTFGLVAPIWDQLDCLLSSLSAGKKAFSVKPTPTKLKVSGVQLFSVGEIHPLKEEGVIQYTDRSLNHYRKLVVKEGKLVGVILYGNVVDGGWYFQLIQNQTDVSNMLDTLIFGEAYCSKSVA
ncbi:FAD-dependent oxidoreductase [Marinomonas sp. 15G1-11]|uniref:FAD-dependent oxidoreductase n=1 Tax=Marinomonas phaeophyticola TaxID=3004091 RepID=A0ABT4K069_9GAMM|nr:FAD-dependent oxidoreductase [Marinomonas sp. 15G1-11]MCZ2723408.1 FAD-dependent oxidoreductase [Marinomonas sp. 15G1-11]